MTSTHPLQERDHRGTSPFNVQVADGLISNTAQQRKITLRLPKEERGMIYKYLGGLAKRIKLNLGEVKERGECDYGILCMHEVVKFAYLTSPATGIPKVFFIESWSRTLAKQE
jgi:hypothetical protein